MPVTRLILICSVARYLTTAQEAAYRVRATGGPESPGGACPRPTRSSGPDDPPFAPVRETVRETGTFA